MNVPAPIEVIECGRPRSNPILSILLNGPSLLKNLPRVDRVFSTMPYMAFLNAIARWFRGAKGVHFIMADDYRLFDDRTLIRSSFLLWLHKLSVRISYRLPLVMIVSSQWVSEQVSQLGLRPEHILCPGVNPEVFKPGENRSRLSGTFQLVTVARKHISKGWSELVKALNLLWEERQDFTLTAITADPISASECRFPASVVSPTEDLELVRYYQQGDLFLFTSRMEGFGLPPLEAMACGVPVISTDIGGIQEYAMHGVNAWLVPVNAPMEMKDSIQLLLDDVSLRDRLRQRGSETARCFTWQAFVDKLEQIAEMSVEQH
jgi:glycosyltransferase involved in cell wall biosynthesis